MIPSATHLGAQVVIDLVQEAEATAAAAVAVLVIAGAGAEGL